MKKVILIGLLVAALIIPTITLAGDRNHNGGGYGNHGENYRGHNNYNYRGRHDNNFWLGFGTGIFIDAIARTPYYYGYGYQPYQRYCEKEIRYGYWELDRNGNRYWVTTRIEIVTVPCY